MVKVCFVEEGRHNIKAAIVDSWRADMTVIAVDEGRHDKRVALVDEWRADVKISIADDQRSSVPVTSKPIEDQLTPISITIVMIVSGGWMWLIKEGLSRLRKGNILSGVLFAGGGVSILYQLIHAVTQMGPGKDETIGIFALFSLMLSPFILWLWFIYRSAKWLNRVTGLPVIVGAIAAYVCIGASCMGAASIAFTAWMGNAMRVQQVSSLSEKATTKAMPATFRAYVATSQAQKFITQDKITPSPSKTQTPSP